MRKMLELLSKPLTPVLNGILVRTIAIAILFYLNSHAIPADALRLSPEQLSRKNGRFEFEVARGFGTRNYGGEVQHNLTLVGIKYEQPFSVDRSRFSKKIRWHISFFSGGSHHPEGAYLLGLNPGIRYDFFDQQRRISPFFEASAGLMMTDISSPDLGSKFQFNEQAGIGLEWRATSRSSLKLSSVYCTFPMQA